MSKQPSRPLRVALNESQFRDLCAGRMVEVTVGYQHIQLILSDIGWAAMTKAVGDARAERQRTTN